ncbi:citrate synthase [Anaplasma phagocytophilum]|uniref:Citrate synthase n=2 Tax=Anaplasma phagocytophilum TaxID=948 RepID=A0A0F3PS25_ANAPH|nr:citrate synthase [Anaplasma phagocytophilum]EOA62819.1 citrate synthase [Anaplasma phagocytophilum str. CRT38]KDB56718.1 type II citrate synthase [Anaplasma phagocytophilum str. CRT35]KJV82039.1 citrate (Si)-synthase [Anaplasma phagocytophilum str. CRT53-1]
MVEKAVLECGDRRISLPVLRGTDGTPVVDITTLYRESNVLTYDPGFMSTAACRSEITFIDGNKGTLRYRGIDIENLIGTPNSFSSIVYLLLKGTLPSETEHEEFARILGAEYDVPEQVMNVIRSFPRDSHPMAILIASFSALAANYHASRIDPLTGAIIAIAKVPGIVASIYRHTANLDFIQADANLEYTHHFIRMMFGDMDDAHRDIMHKALDAIFIMHADHEQNASTSTVRMSGSSGAGLFACLCAGVATLWGPAHGGANEAVIKMLAEIGSPENVSSFIDKVKNNKGKSRLMGFGHRVYKSYDPRARVLRTICKDVLDSLGRDENLLAVAEELESQALRDEYFIERKLYPNVDFYSGIVLRAMGVPVDMYTAFFALARTSGWASQWYEMIQSDEGKRISRPRQLYTGK